MSPTAAPPTHAAGHADAARASTPRTDHGLPYLAGLKRQAKIGAYRLGVNESAICIDIVAHQPLDVILLAGRWTLLDREVERAPGS